MVLLHYACVCMCFLGVYVFLIQYVEWTYSQHADNEEQAEEHMSSNLSLLLHTWRAWRLSKDNP